MGHRHQSRKKKSYKRHLNRLRKHRRQVGLKQKQVAKVLGMKSPSRISKWEKGISFPNLIHLIKLSILYRTPSDSLYTEIRNSLTDEILDSTNQANKEDRVEE